MQMKIREFYFALAFATDKDVRFRNEDVGHAQPATARHNYVNIQNSREFLSHSLS